MKMNNKYCYRALAIAMLIVAVVAVCAYAWNFRDMEIVPDTSKWADFATYLSGTVGVAAVVATLFAFIKTLGQQQELINSQHSMLVEQKRQIALQKQQIEIEKDRDNEEVRKEVVYKRRLALYLYHHFVALRAFYQAAEKAINEKDPRAWYVLLKNDNNHRPRLFLENDRDVLYLMKTLDENMSKSFAASVNFAKRIDDIIGFPFDDDGASITCLEDVEREINSLSDDVLRQGKYDVSNLRTHCEFFIKEAEKLNV